jgi:hypothetical protein
VFPPEIMPPAPYNVKVSFRIDGTLRPETVTHSRWTGKIRELRIERRLRLLGTC